MDLTSGGSKLKGQLLRAVTHPTLDALLRPLRDGSATVLTLHRFVENGEISPHVLRGHLKYLRERNYRFVPLISLVADVIAGRAPPRNAVSFTVDDGYSDFRDLAAPVFAEFDCHVTLFITTGAVDRTTWFWWDLVEYAFEATSARSLSIELGARTLTFDWQSSDQRRAVCFSLTAAMKQVTEAERIDAVDRLYGTLKVNTGGPMPRKYEAMSWDDLRKLTATGLVDVGPHSVTHPILSRVTDQQLTWEIRESWRRLQEQCPTAVPIFCYPNGTPADYSRKVMDAVREAGLVAATTTEPGQLAPLGADPTARYRLPRFWCPNDVPHLAQIVSGIEGTKLRLLQALRG